MNNYITNTESNVLVSAIVSVYNSSHFFEDKINDLINQTIFNKTEIIFVISGSKENEEEILLPYLNQYSNIKLINTKERETIYKAWNRGIRSAKGKFITNANTDDRLKEDAFEKLANFLLNDSDVGLVYADQYYSYVPNETFSEAKSKNKICRTPKFDELLHLDMALIGSQPMWRSSIHFEHNIWFDESFEVSGDHDFELKVGKILKIKKHPEILGTFYRSKKTNKSYENMDVTTSELNRIRYHYIKEYCNTITCQDNTRNIRKFKFYINIPIPFFLLLSKIKKIVFPNKPMVSLEFLYLFMTQCYKNVGKQGEALKICENFLKWRKTEKMVGILQELKRN